jgi:DNA-binding XRE family transcriptional regulator
MHGDEMRTETEVKTKIKANGGSPASRLAALMKEAGFITNMQLAGHIGVSPNTITNWLTGKTEPSKIVMIYLEQKLAIRRVGDI